MKNSKNYSKVLIIKDKFLLFGTQLACVCLKAVGKSETKYRLRGIFFVNLSVAKNLNGLSDKMLTSLKRGKHLIKMKRKFL